MLRHRSLLAASAAVLLCGPLLAACSGAAGEATASSVAASTSIPVPSADESAASPAPDIDAGVDEGLSAAGDLPDGWPEELPFYDDGRLVSLVISEDGLNVNAVWSADATPEDAWSAMDAALRDNGFVPTRESGGEDMLIEDETMRNDMYVRQGFEANVIVLTGDETTVLLNASRI